ncbi:MAG: hypothetical protein RBT49_15585 [Bacteroidales bacterium]|jgi:hypothetical protein|nr:hypothetical protein [Bacteroidales bacterium]
MDNVENMDFDLSILVLKLIESNGPEPELEKQYENIKTHIVKRIGRELTKKDELNLAENIYDYMITEPRTKERINATNSLLNLRFLE